MMNIPDPVELMEESIDRQVGLIDAAGTYPCVYCERRFDLESMQPISGDPFAPAECGRDDCASVAAVSP